MLVFWKILYPYSMDERAQTVISLMHRYCFLFSSRLNVALGKCFTMFYLSSGAVYVVIIG